MPCQLSGRRWVSCHTPNSLRRRHGWSETLWMLPMDGHSDLMVLGSTSVGVNQGPHVHRSTRM